VSSLGLSLYMIMLSVNKDFLLLFFQLGCLLFLFLAILHGPGPQATEYPSRGQRSRFKIVLCHS
jgi:hypothetical protein